MEIKEDKKDDKKVKYKLLTLIEHDFEKIIQEVKDKKHNSIDDDEDEDECEHDHHSQMKGGTKSYRTSIPNKNGIEFKFLMVDYVETKLRNFFEMNLSLSSKCYSGDCKCDDEEDDDDNLYEHRISSDEHPTLYECYNALMDKMHELYLCPKCKKEFSRSSKNMAGLDDVDKLVCNACLMHEDAYVLQPLEVKKKELFDCYICGQENIAANLKADLNCSGNKKHTSDICQSCYTKCKHKCPMCRN